MEKGGWKKSSFLPPHLQADEKSAQRRPGALSRLPPLSSLWHALPLFKNLFLQVPLDIFLVNFQAASHLETSRRVCQMLSQGVSSQAGDLSKSWAGWDGMLSLDRVMAGGRLCCQHHARNFPVPALPLVTPVHL